ncbi:DUF1194 domain-containing protein [Oceaniglobus roseus]|uniref:DUF1194 domain-containing protein n=1 Tax=Oceaniglobus roseus TaxID=1737570 RepID=UPI003CCBA610
MKDPGNSARPRPLAASRAAILPALALLLSVGAAGAACRQALVLGLDVSGSVDAAEYRLQLDGVATALGSAEVRSALAAMPDAPVDLAVFEWAGPADARVIQPWITLADDAAVDAVIARLAGTLRTGTDPSTAIGAALLFGDTLLAQRGACWRQVLDISGDGMSNTGPRPQKVETAAETVVNALVVGSDTDVATDLRQAEVKELSSYFRVNVIRGPEAFVEVALGYEDYARAMQRKLLRELQVMAVGAAAPD